MCHSTTDKSASKWFRMDRLQSSHARVTVVRDGAGRQVEGHAKSQPLSSGKLKNRLDIIHAEKIISIALGSINYGAGVGGGGGGRQRGGGGRAREGRRRKSPDQGEAIKL